MKVRGLDGREYRWNVAGRTVFENDTRPRSSYHLRCRSILRRMFPASLVCEEVTLPGTNGLRLDFYIPQLHMGIEVQGEQHDSMIPHFHANRTVYLEQRRRDADKARWCAGNNVRLVVLGHADDDERWERQIADG